MALSLETIRQWADNPKLIPAPGSFNEGRISNAVQALRQLKAEVKAGRMTIGEYLDIAEPIAVDVTKHAHQLSSANQKGAKAAAAAGWSALYEEGFVENVPGQGWQARVPFNEREYAKLPENVLPTRKEVETGTIPLNYLPAVERYRPEPKAPVPQVNPGPDGTVPPTIGQPPASVTTIPDPANPGNSISVPVVGDPLKNSVPRTVDQAIIEQEAARQAEQQRQAFEAERSIRAQRLTDLAGLLRSEEERKFSQNTPAILESLNSRGLLRSSGLGQALAQERSKLAGESAAVLSQQGLTDRDSEITGIKDILARTQQFQTSGLERKFTIEDFNRESALAERLGAQYTPTVKGGSSVLSGVLGGAATGATAGSALGPWGAGAGAILGAVGGGSTSKGK